VRAQRLGAKPARRGWNTDCSGAPVLAARAASFVARSAVRAFVIHRRKGLLMNANSDTTADQSKNQATKSSGRTFSEQAGRVGDEVQELGRAAASQAGEAASALRERGEDAIDAGREALESSKNELERLIAAHPLKSLLIALGVGAAIGYALRGR
jgi:ElaB/YqjD/DUF883 family membrane-anchored ribosome-binding protein